MLARVAVPRAMRMGITQLLLCFGATPESGVKNDWNTLDHKKKHT